jgi:L-alanine-DL-glutamate epimerase-like enolase superfamily enzyme
MAKVARATSIPIATGERLTTKYDFARLLRAGAAAILQMNLGRVGGILEAKKIAAMAEVDHVQIAPHLYCGPVVGAANIQIATCSPNFLILESKQGNYLHVQPLFCFKDRKQMGSCNSKRCILKYPISGLKRRHHVRKNL